MKIINSKDKYECWYRVSCECSSNTCQKTCKKFIMTSFLIANSGVPNANKYMKKLKSCTTDDKAFKKLQSIREDMVNFVDSGSTLYIYSKTCGNGKSTWAIKLMYRYLAEIAPYNDFVRKAYFIHVPSYLVDLKNNDYRNSYEAREFKEIIQELPLLVLDDIGIIQAGTTDYLFLLSILDYRERNNKATIFTGNLDENNLKEFMDDRLFSRIWDGSIHVQFKGSSKRGVEC